MMTAAFRSLSFLVLLAASGGCQSVAAPETLRPDPGAAVDSVVLERTRCYGTCPAYRLRLAGNGRVKFESRNPADSGSAAADSVPADAVAALVSEAETLGFFELPDVIAADPLLCPDRATDHPTATVTIYWPSGVKAVEDYRGCFAASDHSVAQVIGRLRSLEAAIDSAAGSARWITPGSYR